MYPRILHVFGPLWINGYGFMIAIGMLTFIYLTHQSRYRKKFLTSEQYFNAFFIGFLSAVVGGRFLFVLPNIFTFSGNWIEIFYPWVGGFSLFGSVIFVLVSTSWYLKKIKTPIVPLFDLVALYAPILHAISRLGCLLAGCCYGLPTSLPWGISFSNIDSIAPLHVSLHPTQVYASLAALVLFTLLYLIAKRYYIAHGIIIAVYLLGLSFSRFTIDFFRGDREFWGPLSVEQWVTGILFVISLFWLVVILKKYFMVRKKLGDSRCRSSLL